MQSLNQNQNQNQSQNQNQNQNQSLTFNTSFSKNLVYSSTNSGYAINNLNTNYPINTGVNLEITFNGITLSLYGINAGLTNLILFGCDLTGVPNLTNLTILTTLYIFNNDINQATFETFYYNISNYLQTLGPTTPGTISILEQMSGILTIPNPPGTNPRNGWLIE